MIDLGLELRLVDVSVSVVFIFYFFSDNLVFWVSKFYVLCIGSEDS